MPDSPEAVPLAELLGALRAVLRDVAELIEEQGSVAARAYVLPDVTGARMTMVTMATGSPHARQHSLQRVRETVTELEAALVVWVLETWQPVDGDQQLNLVGEVETRAGLIFRLQAPIGEDEAGASCLDCEAALASLGVYAGAPLIACAWPREDPDPR